MDVMPTTNTWTIVFSCAVHVGYLLCNRFASASSKLMLLTYCMSTCMQYVIIILLPAYT